ITPLQVLRGLLRTINRIELRLHLAVHDERVAACWKTAARSRDRHRRTRSLRSLLAHRKLRFWGSCYRTNRIEKRSLRKNSALASRRYLSGRLPAARDLDVVGTLDDRTLEIRIRSGSAQGTRRSQRTAQDRRPVSQLDRHRSRSKPPITNNHNQLRERRTHARFRHAERGRRRTRQDQYFT